MIDAFYACFSPLRPLLHAPLSRGCLKFPCPASPSVGHEWQAEADVEVTIAEGDTAVGVKAADKAVERAADSAAAQDGKTQQREKMLQGFAEKDSSRSSWRGCADVAGGRGGVGRMARGERQRVVEAALETTEQDNEAVMGKIRARLERCVSRMGQGVVEAALETTEQDNDAVTGKMWARLERCVGEEQGRGVGEGSHDREAQALGLSEQGKEAVMGKIRVQLEIGTALTTCGVDTLPLSPSRSFPNQPAFFPRAPTSQSMLRSMRLLPDKRRRFPILHGCSGALKPGRMTLLLGSPGAGKTTLMTALAGHLDRHLKLTGSITYNGQQLKDFNPARTASYVPECDEHIGEMTVRETMDFSAQLQGRGPFRVLVEELERREKEMGVEPDATTALLMKAMAVEANPSNMVTNYVLQVCYQPITLTHGCDSSSKPNMSARQLQGLHLRRLKSWASLLGLGICADTVVGNALVRGISGGQKKRLTTGEELVGMRQVLLMDEISTGLDSSTTFLIARCLRHLTHSLCTTTLIALLQPAPETFALFDDVLLLAEGHVVYHGPREGVMGLFRSLGFDCPPRKGIADFLLEVTSAKDQAQYWVDKSQPHEFMAAGDMAAAFRHSTLGKQRQAELATPFQPTESSTSALETAPYALSPTQMLTAVFAREWLLMRRNALLYMALIMQVIFTSLMSSTVFLYTQRAITAKDGNIYLGVLFLGITMMLFNAFFELLLFTLRLPIFFKQRNTRLYPAWAWVLPMAVLSLPLSAVVAALWTAGTYFLVGFAPEAGRFFIQLLIFFLIHQTGVALFRLLGAVGRNLVVSITLGNFAFIILFLLGGFIVSKDDIQPWFIWAYWMSPITYTQNALSVNELLAPRWQKVRGVPGGRRGGACQVAEGEGRARWQKVRGVPGGRRGGACQVAEAPLIPNSTVGLVVLEGRGLPTESKWVLIGVLALIGFTLLLNALVVVALSVLHRQTPCSLPTTHVHCSSFSTQPTNSRITPTPLINPIHTMPRHHPTSAWAKDQPVTEEQLDARIEAAVGLTAATATSRRLSKHYSTGSRRNSESHGRGGGMDGDAMPISISISITRSQSGQSARSVGSRSGGALERYCERVSSSHSMGHTIEPSLSQDLSVPPTTTRGMVLPFLPLPVAFHNVCYWVDMPPAMRSHAAHAAGNSATRLQLLRNVSGAFRPKVLTALVGVTGAGKTTLMDVLAGRKTGGYIEGDVMVAGHPKVHETFARVSGYCEQSDIHSPQVTVHESLLFSAWLRLPRDIDRDVREEFVEEVMELVELDVLRGALVGLPGVNGLSTEQRKRLTIGVELVANPSIIFMDEPTSGLDARAAAIVMRTVRNTVDTGRTVVCTIHQPSTDIFEAFDELLLMKTGGEVIYMGPLGVNSKHLIKYLQAVPGVQPIPDGYNPATWMLEVTAPAAAESIGADFAEIFRNSQLFRDNEALIASLSAPPPNTAPLHFPTRYSTSFLTQFLANFWKRALMYWRAPDFNAVRFFLAVCISLLMGAVMFGFGHYHSTQQEVLNVMGALYVTSLLMGWNAATSLQPMLCTERTVFYRERAAGLYGSLPYALAQGAIETPYVVVETLLFCVITYALLELEWTAGKFWLYCAFICLTLLCFASFGMMAVAITPNELLAVVLSGFFVMLWNLMCGFLIPKPEIPVWWSWFYYINPIAWSLYGLITSQLGNVQDLLTIPGYPVKVTVQQFLDLYLGYQEQWVGYASLILVAFSALFFVVFAVALKVINFQKR
ncbi:unnamed protein product [Closterium sp. NIES-65]|nr:unnamed protein product [Closterium sp. NIES-65]